MYAKSKPRRARAAALACLTYCFCAQLRHIYNISNLRTTPTNSTPLACSCTTARSCSKAWFAVESVLSLAMKQKSSGVLKADCDKLRKTQHRLCELRVKLRKTQHRRPTNSWKHYPPHICLNPRTAQYCLRVGSVSDPRDLNHTNRYQMFIFNNNVSTLEGSPKWSLNVVHTGIASQ